MTVSYFEVPNLLLSVVLRFSSNLVSKSPSQFALKVLATQVFLQLQLVKLLKGTG